MLLSSIMIVDDSLDDQYLAERSLSDATICQSFFLKDNGQDALNFFIDYDAQKKLYGNKVPPIVILLDINMPVMNGFEFLDAFKNLRIKNHELSNIKVVVFSSSDNEKDIQRARSYEFVKDYWVKSARPDEIVNKFKELVEKSA